MKIIGIDPGQSGGIAVREETGIIVARPMPETERDLWDLILEITFGGGACMAYIEKVHSMPGQGVSSTFKFGYNYGMLRAFLIAASIPIYDVTPQRWQKEMGCLSKGDKKVTKARAQELWPLPKITHATADAMLIAEYGRRQYIKNYSEGL